MFRLTVWLQVYRLVCCERSRKCVRLRQPSLVYSTENFLLPPCSGHRAEVTFRGDNLTGALECMQRRDETFNRRFVAILLPDLRGGGAERVMLDLAHEFARQGHTVEFVLRRARGELLDEARSSFPVVELGVDRARQVPLALARYLRRRRPDALLTAMWPLTSAAVAARWLARSKTRIVVSDHGMLSAQYAPRGCLHRLLMRASMMLTYRFADSCVAVSKGLAEDVAMLAAMNTGDIAVIHNPVRMPSSNVDTAPAEKLWGDAGGKRIVTVGRMKQVKNHALLLRAFAMLPQSLDATLMLVGNGELETVLRAQAVQLGISDRVVFAGFQTDPAPFYATADLFVLSSDREGFGNVIVEALAAGTPVVSTDCPAGPAEILDGGRFGTLVPVGDEMALAAAIARTLGMNPDRERLRSRALAFAPEVAAARYLELLACPVMSIQRK